MAADSIWLMLLGYFAVIAGLSLHVLSEAGTTIASFKAYLKSYPLRIISGFIASTFIYITWMANGLDLGEEILVLEKGQVKLFWAMIIGGAGNLIFIKGIDRLRETKIGTRLTNGKSS